MRASLIGPESAPRYGVDLLPVGICTSQSALAAFLFMPNSEDRDDVGGPRSRRQHETAWNRPCRIARMHESI